MLYIITEGTRDLNLAAAAAILFRRGSSRVCTKFSSIKRINGNTSGDVIVNTVRARLYLGYLLPRKTEETLVIDLIFGSCYCQRDMEFRVPKEEVGLQPTNS